MKNLCDLCPDFMKRLWFQLAMTYTVLAICAMVLIIVVLYGINDYKDFRIALTPENVMEQVLEEQRILLHAIREPNGREWLNEARANIHEKLINMEEGKNVTIYRITNSSRPEIYMQIKDRGGRVLLSDPPVFPQNISDQLSMVEQSLQERAIAKWLERENGSIWVNMPIMDERGDAAGHLLILYIAKFDIWIQFLSILDFLASAWDWVIICSIPIGVICGLVASRYVTKQLHKMNEVTESWRSGNFEPRITLPGDDVLIRHSQHLNDMAQDLEMYLRLKENLAVNDERNRVARELHDTVKQKLFALGLQLATAKSRPAVMDVAGEHILEAELITREAQHDLMEIITQLRPAGTSDVDLQARIGMLADDFHRRFHVHIELEDFPATRFHAHIEHHVLRIIQESLMNAVRHGKASRIVITGGVTEGVVTLRLVDNGRGFDTAQKTGGFGIISMRDRTQDLPDGLLEIKSNPGEGTSITVSWRAEI